MSGVESLVTQVQQPGYETNVDQKPQTKSGNRSCFSRIMCCLGSNDNVATDSTTKDETVMKQPVSVQQDKQQYQKNTYEEHVVKTPDNQVDYTQRRYEPTEYDVGDRVPLRDTWLLPPLTPENRHKKTLVLDLDETLVHSSFKPITDHDFEIVIPLENAMHTVYVRKRPLVDQFLRHVAKKWEIIIFTASLSKYADPLLDILDANRVVATRLFRESCVYHNGNYVKDLTMLGRRLENTVIIDNSPLSYAFQKEYAIPITSWFMEKSDRQLEDLMPFLDQLADCPDVEQMLARTRMCFTTGGYVPPQNNSSIIAVHDEDMA